jgi:glutamyl-tRNA reductase
MDLSKLIKPIDLMTDEELKERLKEIRHRRETVRPAAQEHKRKAATKKVAPVVSKLDKLLAGMSPAEREELLRSLEGGL